ncbi:MAG: DUF2997 domain-containing protein [Pseudonocardiaceae bacterium]
MAEQTRLVVRVAVDGTINAETHNVTGPACLEYISLLEDILEADTTSSAYTADYTRSASVATTEARNELRQS